MWRIATRRLRKPFRSQDPHIDAKITRYILVPAISLCAILIVISIIERL